MKLSPEVAAIAGGGRTHPTFVEIGTNKPLYVHRTGSNVVNGRYYVDKDPHKTSATTARSGAWTPPACAPQYEAAAKLPPAEAMKGSPLGAGARVRPLPRYLTVSGSAAPEVVAGRRDRRPERARASGWRRSATTRIRIADRRPRRWRPATSRQTHVGDEFDTSPFPDPALMGISVEAYIRNMGVLIRALGMP